MHFFVVEIMPKNQGVEVLYPSITQQSSSHLRPMSQL